MLRIEDTDASRNQPEWTEGILSAPGLDRHRARHRTRVRTSSPPTPQAHTAAGTQLYEAGRAYYCDCTREHDPGAHRQAQYSGYDGFCRDRGLTAGPDRALRFRTPDEGATVVVDLLRGEPTFDNKLIEDFVIARSDGSAVFLLANVVDDMTMGITHVIRAEEHLPNTPKQQLLWEALGAHAADLGARAGGGQREAPEAVQAPRQGRPGGLPGRGLPGRRHAQLPDAARLGAHRRPGDRAVVGDRGRVPARGRQPVAGVLRREEAAGVQRRVHPGAVARRLHRGLPAVADRDTRGGPEDYDPAAFAAVAALAQTRIALLAEIVPNVDFLFLAGAGHRRGVLAKAMTDRAADLLAAAAGRVRSDSVRGRPQTLKDALEEVGAALGLKLGKAQAPVRVAVDRPDRRPAPVRVLEVLGRDRTLTRLRAALTKLCDPTNVTTSTGGEDFAPAFFFFPTQRLPRTASLLAR